MSARDPIGFEEPPFAMPREKAPQRINQYTPVIERPWFLVTFAIAVLALYVARSWGWV